MKRIMITGLMLSLALLLIVACTQATPTPTQAVPTAEEATVETPAETVPPSPTAAATEVEETEAPATATPTEDPAEEETEPVDAVEALIVERCSGCHSVDRVFNADKSAEQWASNIDRMVDYGAIVSEAEKEEMIDWLVSRED